MPHAQDLMFYHIPKTAGSSVRRVLEMGFPAELICPAHNWTDLLNLEKSTLGKYKVFEGHFHGDISGYLCRNLYEFTILRDPIERALSQYGQVLRDECHYLRDRIGVLTSIEAFIEDPVAQATISNYQARMLALDVNPVVVLSSLPASGIHCHALERELEVFGALGEMDCLLEKASARLAAFSFVGLQERLVESIAILCDDMQWPFPTEIPVENVNAVRVRREDVCNDTVARLIELNRVDIELYRRAQVLFDRRITAMLTSCLENKCRWGRLDLPLREWLGIGEPKWPVFVAAKVMNNVYWRATKAFRLPSRLCSMLFRR